MKSNTFIRLQLILVNIFNINHTDRDKLKYYSIRMDIRNEEHNK